MQLGSFLLDCHLPVLVLILAQIPSSSSHFQLHLYDSTQHTGLHTALDTGRWYIAPTMIRPEESGLVVYKTSIIMHSSSISSRLNGSKVIKSG
jgi:hypothetical protein